MARFVASPEEPAMSAQLFNLFNTPIMVIDNLINDPAITGRIKELILNNRANTPNVQRSNRHGWESSLDFHDWDDDAVRTLKSRLHGMFLNLTAKETGIPPQELEMTLRDSALANVGERGAYHIPHIHRNCSWSAVYYADVPDPNGNGLLELLDPRTNPIIPGVHRRKSAVTITPATDKAVCFPSWLEHWVHPWESDLSRISIAWNATILKAGRKEAQNSTA